MKVEKIQKCMSKRTVVVKTNEPVTVGVITGVDHDDNTVIVSGYTPEDGDCDYNWAGFGLVRKATDDERAAFFAWLREDGDDIAGGFERFGGAPRGWEDAPAPDNGRAVFNVDTPINQRGQVVGKRVRCLDNDGDNGRVGMCTHADNTRLPYRITFDDGDERYVYSVEMIDGAPAPARTTPKRLTVGDSAIAVSRAGSAVMGEITKDDYDGAPYWFSGTGCFRASQTHPLTLDGFRAAAAQQRAAGVTFEEGDYAAMIDNDGEVNIGAIFRRKERLHLQYDATHDIVIKGAEDWSDRVVVLTKRPKI